MIESQIKNFAEDLDGAAESLFCIGAEKTYSPEMVLVSNAFHFIASMLTDMAEDKWNYGEGTNLISFIVEKALTEFSDLEGRNNLDVLNDIEKEDTLRQGVIESRIKIIDDQLKPCKHINPDQLKDILFIKERYLLALANRLYEYLIGNKVQEECNDEEGRPLNFCESEPHKIVISALDDEIQQEQNSDNNSEKFESLNSPFDEYIKLVEESVKTASKETDLDKSVIARIHALAFNICCDMHVGPYSALYKIIVETFLASGKIPNFSKGYMINISNNIIIIPLIDGRNELIHIPDEKIMKNI